MKAFVAIEKDNRGIYHTKLTVASNWLATVAKHVSWKVYLADEAVTVNWGKQADVPGLRYRENSFLLEQVAMTYGKYLASQVESINLALAPINSYESKVENNKKIEASINCFEPKNFASLLSDMVEEYCEQYEQATDQPAISQESN